MILLASHSPRRLKLLTERFGPNNVVACASEHNEAHREGEPPDERVKRLAREKCSLVKNKADGEIRYVIAADTEVVLNGKSMGQPADEAEARRFLRQLSGRTHSVITGLAIFDTLKDAMQVELAETKVTFRELQMEEIDAYIETGEPMDKAGAYGIQGKGGQFAEKIEGSYTNVVGLPMELLQQVLTE
jgi:septum formation protein